MTNLRKKSSVAELITLNRRPRAGESLRAIPRLTFTVLSYLSGACVRLYRAIRARWHARLVGVDDSRRVDFLGAPRGQSSPEVAYVMASTSQFYADVLGIDDEERTTPCSQTCRKYALQTQPLAIKAYMDRKLRNSPHTEAQPGRFTGFRHLISLPPFGITSNCPTLIEYPRRERSRREIRRAISRFPLALARR